MSFVLIRIQYSVAKTNLSQKENVHLIERRFGVIVKQFSSSQSVWSINCQKKFDFSSVTWSKLWSITVQTMGMN